MFNIILDKLPTNYKGYLIRTDFRVGIQILLCLQDVELNQMEGIATAFNLLYGNSRPPIDIATEGLRWFIMAGKKNNKQDIDNKKVFDFEKDNNLIFSAFKKAYGIDLKTVKMHWFEFMSLMQDLGNCAFTNIIDIRSKDLSKLKGQEQTAYAKLQRTYSLNDPQEEKYTEEEIAKIEEFEKALKEGEKIEWQADMTEA